MRVLVGEEEGTSRTGNGHWVLREKGDLCGSELWEPCWAELGEAARVGDLSLFVATERISGLTQGVSRRY